MRSELERAERRTSADIVFDYLYDEIVTLRLLPNARISETDIAARFSVSRQPVRDAFSRLGNLDLVHVRPQRATEVRRFSSRAIATARFVRAAVEMEVLRRAAEGWDGRHAPLLRESLSEQGAAVAAGDDDAFHELDYDFHRRLCIAAGSDYAFEEIARKKAVVDRLCVLSLANEAERMGQLLDDHAEIVDRIAARDPIGAQEAGRRHLSRLDATIAAIRAAHSDYFED